ncbi:uncharacterized protein VTP21DRAFT_4697 [Calcarisporiella thermophila]|uniref:uncharacterized protein n=1 Tax=Calcarisporiella thermophila TaxID=911321 RepID=UPI003742B2CC
MSKAVKRWVPVVEWLPAYKWREDLIQDLIAGATISTVIIPQCMAYAMLAELPPVYGLYTSIAPILIYCVFGTSRHLSAGTFALTSLLLGQAVTDVLKSSLSDPNTPIDNAYFTSTALLITFFVGATQIVFGLLRLGRFAASNLLPDPLVLGFNTAAAVHISSSQLKHLFGFHIPRSKGIFVLFKVWKHLLFHLKETNIITLIIGLVAMALLLGIKQLENVRRKKLLVQKQLEEMNRRFSQSSQYRSGEHNLEAPDFLGQEEALNTDYYQTLGIQPTAPFSLPPPATAVALPEPNSQIPHVESATNLSMHTLAEGPDQELTGERENVLKSSLSDPQSSSADSPLSIGRDETEVQIEVGDKRSKQAKGQIKPRDVASNIEEDEVQIDDNRRSGEISGEASTINSSNARCSVLTLMKKLTNTWSYIRSNTPSSHIPLPDVLMTVLFLTTVSFVFKFNQKFNVSVIGDIPQGLPIFHVPLDMLLNPPADLEFTPLLLIQPVLVISVVAYVMTISIGKQFAKQFKYSVDPDQELIALGLSSLGGSCLSSYVSCGSLTRSVILAQTGARSQLASFVGVIVVILTLLWLTPLFYYLPQTVLAAVIINACVGLLRGQLFEGWRMLRMGDKRGALLWWSTFLGVVFLSVEVGIIVGVCFVLILLAYDGWRKYRENNEGQLNIPRRRRGSRVRSISPDTGYSSDEPLLFDTEEE